MMDRQIFSGRISFNNVKWLMEIDGNLAEVCQTFAPSSVPSLYEKKTLDKTLNAVVIRKNDMK
jgi:hypothetical protein